MKLTDEELRSWCMMARDAEIQSVIIEILESREKIKQLEAKLQSPQIKAERAYLDQKQTTELNRKLRINGVSIRAATIEDWQLECETLTAENKQLEARGEEMREALEFYANEKNWYDVNHHEAGKPTMKMVIGSIDTSGSDWVGGHTARQALSPKETK